MASQEWPNAEEWHGFYTWLLVTFAPSRTKAAEVADCNIGTFKRWRDQSGHAWTERDGEGQDMPPLPARLAGLLEWYRSETTPPAAPPRPPNPEPPEPPWCY